MKAYENANLEIVEVLAADLLANSVVLDENEAEEDKVITLS